MRHPLPRLAAAAFRALATAREARAVHPAGRTFTATVRIRGGGRYGVPFLDQPGDWPALVRFSRGAGLPDGWPDVLGVAVRVLDAGGPGADLDLLFSTAVSAAPVGRLVPAPRRRLAGPYLTIAGYRTRRGRRHLALLPDPTATDPGTRLRDLTVAADGGGVGGGVRLLLAIAPRHARWRVCGGVAVGAPVAATVDAGLAFDPVVHALPGLDPDGLLHSIRAGAYAGSRRGRGVGLTRDGSRATDRS